MPASWSLRVSKYLVLSAPLVLAILVSVGAEVEKTWKKVSDDDGIIVYECTSPGMDTVSLRGEAIIAAKARDIAQVMANNERASVWVPMVAERRVLKTVGVTQRVELTHIAMPWPVTDRYFVALGQADFMSDGRIRLSVKSVSDPENYLVMPDKVLGVLHTSEFLLTPMANDSGTRIEFEVNTDPKGLIPKWIVNYAQTGWPRDFLTGLAKELAVQGLLLNRPAARPKLAH